MSTIPSISYSNRSISTFSRKHTQLTKYPKTIMSSIMIIGASGRLGLALIRSTAAHPSTPSIHAFLRTPTKLPRKEAHLCTTVQQGDALERADLQRAIQATHPDIIIIAIGVPDSVSTSRIRQDSARVLMSLISTGSRFEHIRVVCVSSHGAGGSKIKLGFGMGSLLEFYLRKVLRDHDVQEEVLISCMGFQKATRLLIIRPTALVDGNPGGRIVTFGNRQKVPTLNIDRDDAARYIVDTVCGKENLFGKVINIATARN